MCSYLFKRSMENYQGDLTDIIRSTAASAQVQEWQFPNNPLMNYSHEYFGDPFADMRDPFLHDMACHEDGTGDPDKIIAGDHEIKTRPDPRILKAATPNDQSCSFSRRMENPAAPLQISSTGVKRRKSQAKKVVCIPATAPAKSRPTGEIVPSDLWAWRKYGQKPIKGSPYPRGYYRCSSSKGCSARKQVERSRTDPNMLVITYTSEHNHPWPTQRNALAGSTRSQTSKTSSTSKINVPSNSQAQKSANPRQEKKKITRENIKQAVPAVKEEMDEDNLETEDHADFDEGFPQSYKPTMSESEESNFFVDIGEMVADPLNLLFTQDGLISGGENSSLDPFAFYDWAAGSSSIDNTSACTTSFVKTKKDS